MTVGKPRKLNPFSQWHPAHLPHVNMSCREVESFSNLGCMNRFDQRAMGMSMSHAPFLHTRLKPSTTNSQVVLNRAPEFEGPMLEIAKRIRQRVDEMDVTYTEVAKAAGITTARLGNYTSLSEKNNRTPDVRGLMKLATALRTSTDWLLGLSETPAIDVAAVVQRLLEIDGMSPAKAEVIAQTAARAIELLSALPGDGDVQTRSHLAAQAAWQMRSQSKPS